MITDIVKPKGKVGVRKNRACLQKTRDKIQTTQIIKRLTKHALDEPILVDGNLVYKDLMTQSQVTAALGLIKKTLPDLQAIEYKGEIDINDTSRLTDDQIIDRLESLRTATTQRVIEQAESETLIN